MHDELQVVAERLARFREKHGYSFQEIGDQIGLTRSHLSKLEACAALPSFKTLYRLAELMNIPFYALFIPAETEERVNFIQAMNRRLDEWQWDLQELHRQTGINYYHLADVAQGKTLPARAEQEKITEVLQLPSSIAIELKFNMFAMFLEELGLETAQIKNLLDYLKASMKVR